jgi:hypothetical protein
MQMRKTNFILRIKEQETHLNLLVHDDDDDEEEEEEKDPYTLHIDVEKLSRKRDIGRLQEMMVYLGMYSNCWEKMV